MNREVRRLELKKQIAESEKTIAKCELEIMDIEDEELFEQYELEFDNEINIVQPTKMGNIIEIDNGIQLAASACNDYADVHYVGGGVIKTGIHKCKFTAPQIVMLQKEYDNIPKKGIDTRKKWAKKITGYPVRIDTILWNMYRGKFQQAIEDYSNESPLKYKEGQVIF